MKASLKSINITPPIGMQMAGYSERNQGAQGIHDELYARVCVLDDGKKKIALVICDVIGFDLYVTNKVRKLVALKTDIDEDAIMISAIHTHSSVYACRLHGMDFLHTKRYDEESDDAYYQQMIQKIANGIIWANANMIDAKIGFGVGTVDGLGTNRNDPHAYYDYDVNVIKICDIEDNVIGIIVNHACHPTVLNQENYLYSADFPAYVTQALEKSYPDAVVAFSQGAAGSASTRYTKKASSFEEAKRLGELLAKAAQQVIPVIPMHARCNFHAQCKNLLLHVKTFPTDEECRIAIENYKHHHARLIEQGKDTSEIRKAYVTLQGAQREYMTSKQVDFESVTTIMQVLDFDVCKIISIPGDVFGEIGRDVKELKDSKPIIVAGYTNDFVGYIVSHEGYDMDCYEKNMTIFDETSHDRIIEVAKSLL